MSVWVAVKVSVCVPVSVTSGVAGVTDQLPNSSTTAVSVAISLEPSLTVTVTVAPASPVPEMVGVASLMPVSSVSCVVPVMTGASGAVVSSVKVIEVEAPSLPASSTWRTRTVCEPSSLPSLA